MMFLLFAVAVVGDSPADIVPPPPPAYVVIGEARTLELPIQATPQVPIHEGRPQAAEGQTAEDATTLADDGFGFPVETGGSEIARLGQPYDVRDLAELCMAAKPWLCD